MLLSPDRQAYAIIPAEPLVGAQRLRIRQRGGRKVEMSLDPRLGSTTLRRAAERRLRRLRPRLCVIVHGRNWHGCRQLNGCVTTGCVSSVYNTDSVELTLC
jgi:hypothetical protein